MYIAYFWLFCNFEVWEIVWQHRSIVENGLKFRQTEYAEYSGNIFPYVEFYELTYAT